MLIEQLDDEADDGAVWLRVPRAQGDQAADLLTTAIVESLQLGVEQADHLAQLLAASVAAVQDEDESTDREDFSQIELAVSFDLGLGELRILAGERGGVGSRPDGTPLPGGLERNSHGAVGTILSLSGSRASGSSRAAFRGPLFVRAVLPRLLARSSELEGAHGVEQLSRIVRLGDRIADILAGADHFGRLRVNVARVETALELQLWRLSEEQARLVEELLEEGFPEATIEPSDRRAGRPLRELLSLSMPLPAAAAVAAAER